MTVIQVVLEDGNQIPVTNRIAEMIAFVVARAERIEQAATVKIEHNCSNSRVQSKLTFFEIETAVMR